MLIVFAATYAAVFGAEIVGDKLLYTTSVLATRYRTTPMLSGIVLACAAKMGVAVSIGRTMTALPPPLVASAVAAGFIVMAVALARPARESDASERRAVRAKGTLVSFASVVFSEWADPGQVTAAVMAARFSAPGTVWLGALAAMLTKAALALLFGATMRRWTEGRLSARVIRYGGAALLLILGMVSVIEALAAEGR